MIIKTLTKISKATGYSFEFESCDISMDGKTIKIRGLVKETEKAYGACQRCYGKGYSTLITEGGVGVVICGCDRGKQLCANAKNLKEV